MSRDQIIAALLSCGAFSLVQTIEDVEAGRVRRVRIDPVPGDLAFSREVIEFLRSIGAEVEVVRPASRRSLRRAG
jgi:hypothetical protein